ncbi:MAG TPA: hypothetical protein VNJ07_03650 [Chitinophagales bacterium]|nr:hypothetical protein [Chitinophagales bacterium]
MRVNIFLSALLIFTSQLLFAQKSSLYDVYLKNGTIIRGKVVELSSEKVKIELSKGVISIFEMNEVEKVLPAESMEKTRKEPVIKTNGFFNAAEFRVLAGSGNDGDKFSTAYSFQNVSGYQVNRYFRLGGGIGIDHYNEYSHTFIPLFAQVSGDVVKGRVTPVYFADAGYSFLIEKDEYTNGAEEAGSKGGLLIHGGLGLKFYTASRVSFSLLAGFKVQHSERSYTYSWNEGYVYREDRVYRRHTFGLGICF